jgi:hypothetical protein
MSVFSSFVACFVTVLSLLTLLDDAAAAIPEPTAFGTVECKEWPIFELQDYNPATHATYLQSYGLGDIQPGADVTIVGLYMADSPKSQAAIVYKNEWDIPCSQNMT